MPFLRGYRFEYHGADGPIEDLPIPETLCVPMPGAEESYARIAAQGDLVAAGQVLSAPKYAAAAHAPVSGVVEAVEFRQIPGCGHVWAAVLRREGGFDAVIVNQVTSPRRMQQARALAGLLEAPVFAGEVQKGRLIRLAAGL